MRVRRGVVARATGMVAALTAVTLAVAAAPASAAVAAFRARVLVRSGCIDAFSQTSSTGVTRGVLLCSTTTSTQEMVFFHGDGTTWTKVRTGVGGKPVAFADDGTSYFAIYAPTNAKGAVMLLKRNHSTGVQTKITLRAATAATADDSLDFGALLVSGGKYWAAFSINNGAILTGRTLTKQNLIASLPSSMPAVDGWEPALARRGATGGVVMVVDQPPPSEAGIIVRYGTHADGTWGRTVLRAAAGGRSPQVLWNKGVTQVAWLELSPTGYHVVYQENSSGAWVRRTLPGLAGTNWLRLRMFSTGGKTTVAYSGHEAGSSTSLGRVVVTQRSAGTWSTTAFAAATDGNQLMGAGGWSGKSIVLFSPALATTSAVYSRRQA